RCNETFLLLSRIFTPSLARSSRVFRVRCSLYRLRAVYAGERGALLQRVPAGQSPIRVHDKGGVAVMHVRSIAGVLAGALVLAACSDTPPTRPDVPELSLNRAGKIEGPKSYIIVADGETLPEGLESA